MLALGLEGLCAAGVEPCGVLDEVAVGLGVLLWLLLAGVAAGLGSGVSGVNGTGVPTASTICEGITNV